jgi:hypothetical protein
VQAAYSGDGTTWTIIATTTVTVPATFDVGIVVTSHDPTQLNTAHFDHVSVAP